MNIFEIGQIIIGTFNLVLLAATFVGATYIGRKANEINDRVRALQDYVAIAVVPDNSVIKLLNVGKTNLYLWGFDMPGNSHRFERPRLIPAGTYNEAYYYIGTPTFDLPFEEMQNKLFEFKLYLEDEFQNKWTTYAGGEIFQTEEIETEGKKGVKILLRVWTYRTSKEVWEF